jgi:hypothetical protein
MKRRRLSKRRLSFKLRRLTKYNKRRYILSVEIRVAHIRPNFAEDARSTQQVALSSAGTMFVQGGSNMTGTNCDLFTHE